jgi:hypothetical protein
MSHVEPTRERSMTSDDSQTTVPYDATVGDDTLIADEEMPALDEWNVRYEQQVREEREKTPTPEGATSKPTWKGRPPSQERGRDTVIQTIPERNRRPIRGEKSMRVYLERIDAAATLGEKSKDETKTTVAAATLGEKSDDKPETVVTAIAPLGEKLSVRKEDESVVAATLDHSTPREERHRSDQSDNEDDCTRERNVRDDGTNPDTDARAT